jgi:hypothetical protein
MEFAHITYKNNQHPIRISYAAMKHFSANTKKSIDDLGGDMNLYEELLWQALRSGAKYCDADLELKREEMEDVLDHCFFDFVELIPGFFPKKKTTEPSPTVQ